MHASADTFRVREWCRQLCADLCVLLGPEMGSLLSQELQVLDGQSPDSLPGVLFQVLKKQLQLKDKNNSSNKITFY